MALSILSERLASYAWILPHAIIDRGLQWMRRTWLKTGIEIHDAETVHLTICLRLSFLDAIGAFWTTIFLWLKSQRNQAKHMLFVLIFNFESSILLCIKRSIAVNHTMYAYMYVYFPGLHEMARDRMTDWLFQTN